MKGGGAMGEKPYILKMIEPVVYKQTLPVDDITIYHGKGKLAPIVLLLDNEGNEFEAEIRRPDENHIRVLTNMPVIFTAYIY